MFIRASSQTDKKTCRQYTTYRLVESYRNQAGKVRQRTLLNLGCHFSIPKEQWKFLADRIEEICAGQASLFEIDNEIEQAACRIAKLVIKKHADLQSQSHPTNHTATGHQTDYQCVDVNSLSHDDSRKIGAEYLGIEAAKQIHLDKILDELGFNQKKINIALGSIIGRLVHPGSELNTHRYLSTQSSLDELLTTDFSNLSLKNLYKISDELLKNKAAIESALYKREKELFNLDEVIALYDITNTYFEGNGNNNDKAQYGRSKEKRSDCPLVSLGLVLDGSGFVKKSNIFPGNISEPKTLSQMLEVLGSDRNTVVIMDAGFATEENIQWLKQANYQFIVVSRKQNLVMPQDCETIVVKEAPNNLVRASLIENKETDEMELYCHSQAKAGKSKAMISKASARFETDLQRLTDGLNKKGCTKKHQKVIEKVGRLKEKHKKVGQFYDVTVIADDDNTFTKEITWSKKADKIEKNESGVYCLRTNKKDFEAKKLWQTYTMLTELEAAFRCLKSALGFRPVYHQKEKRVDGHLFISLLAYHLLHTIRYQLKAANIHDSWETLREILDTHCRITSTLQVEDGRTVKIRKTSSPNANQALIYKGLGLDSHPGKTEKAYF